MLTYPNCKWYIKKKCAWHLPCSRNLYHLDILADYSSLRYQFAGVTKHLNIPLRKYFRVFRAESKFTLFACCAMIIWSQAIHLPCMNECGKSCWISLNRYISTKSQSGLIQQVFWHATRATDVSRMLPILSVIILFCWETKSRGRCFSSSMQNANCVLNLTWN